MNLTYLINHLTAKFVSQYGQLPFSFVVYTPDGQSIPVGTQPPSFEVYIHNKTGLKALKSLNQLKVADAYIEGHLDLQGDLIKAFLFQELLSDKNIGLKIWRRVKPLLIGRKKCNPAWIAKHYDASNIQLLASDENYNAYTPGHYETEADSLEVGAERKLKCAFDSLKLKPNDTVLDIGCGWGGFLRYAARRDIHVTGITLSKHQKAYTEKLIKDNQFNAQVLYQDFFAFKPSQKYDGIVMMGVIEDLSDYLRVMKCIAKLVKPGGRVFLDFAASKLPFGTSSFITKHVWPGTFRMVFMPQFIDAVRMSPFEIINIHNDLRNYHLWSKKVNERWEAKKENIVAQTSEELWRIFRMLYAGTASVMNKPSHKATAYRVVLEYPLDFK